MSDMDARTRFTRLFSAAVLLGALAVPARGQMAEPRWLPFVGCWTPVDAESGAGMLCFRPSGQGVEMSNIVNGQVASSEQLVADGSRRPVTAQGCTGGESVDFSESGLRVFTHSQFDCQSETRSGSGVMAFISPGQWVDVRSLDVQGEPVAWVQRYSAATPKQLSDQGVEDPAASDRALVRAARVRASRDIDIDDVKEAASQIDERAVEVWVATRASRFDLTADKLEQLADSGVPSGIIDVMVAVTYPDRFAVSPEGMPSTADRTAQYAYRDGYRRGFRSFLWDPFYNPVGFGFGYSPYGYYSSPFYSPFGYYGYGYGGVYGGYYGYRPAPIVIQPRSQGQMINGRGYTRGSSSGTTSGGARPRSSAPSPSPSRSAGSRPSSSSSSGPSRGGSSHSSSGRTAHPRGG
jgi:hypothetical protein